MGCRNQECMLVLQSDVERICGTRHLLVKNIHDEGDLERLNLPNCYRLLYDGPNLGDLASRFLQ